MGEGRADEPRRTRRLTVAQAAAQLGITEGAVRSRIKRGTLPTERTGGTVYVVLSPSASDEPSADHVGGLDERLIQSYEARIDDLRAQLEQANEANRENRRIIAALTSRIPELEAPSEPRESPESATESGEGAEPRSGTEGPQRRSWWREFFGFD